MKINRGEDVVSLAIASRKLVPDGREGPDVWLTGVTHVGEAEYFKQLQTHLGQFELVLYEGVGDSPRLMKRMGMKQPKGVQDQLADALGLAFQLEAIDYESSDFQNCDVSMQQLQLLMQSMAEESEEGKDAQEELKTMMGMLQGEGFMSAAVEGLLAWLEQNPNLRNAVKYMFIEMLGNLEGDLAGANAPGEMQKLMTLLIDERNKVVLRELQRRLFSKRPPKSISVFYGAGHMHDLEERIVDELGYVAQEEEWYNAISLDLKKAGFRASDIQLIQRLARMQIDSMQ